MSLTKGFVALVLTLVAAQAHADRWILKNPETIAPNMKVIKSLELGNSKYVVVESAAYKTSKFNFAPSINLMAVTHAEAALPDLKIGVDNNQGNNVVPAWHVGRMKYSEIPADITGAGITVAVLDTGVDYSHSALATSMWTNTQEIAGNGIDDDNNGYVDDVRGYNFSDKKGDPQDNFDHGTHCAGIIGADTQAGGIARGVAQGVQIMAVKIIGDSDEGFLSDAALGVKYAVDNGAQVLSNSWRIYQSWSGYYNEEGVKLLGEALRYAEAQNVIFVAAAGNETTDITNGTDPIFPAGMEGHPNLLVVAATDNGDGMAYYSNFGAKHVQVAAPGSDILSTIPGNQWMSMSGTSMATPLVAGVVALGLQKGYTAEEAMARLQATSDATPWGAKVMSGGIINIIEYLK